ncbi:glycosyltransferase [Paenibacillus sp. LMG 31456]|uniref:Glycosyltransferase n=1 Tax=Paenibacillus foliorum TaxID=2654974 RepID=A0A972GSX8_9BACL|nr:glycosyltransferase [Paenibacillus foliorum]NOU93869.1 glycosyltransferase [Paenibacillus foliorum]
MTMDIVFLTHDMQDLRESVSNLRLSTEEPFNLIVVAEENTRELADWHQQNKQARLLIGRKGQSVAAGYNLGASASSSPLIVFMRDFMYVTDGWLARLRDCLLRHERAAAAAPLSSGVSGAQNIPVSNGHGGNFNYLANGLASAFDGQSIQVNRLLGQFLMMRKSAFDQLGEFDERFEQEGYEDDDFCYRALLDGYELHIAKDCYVRYERQLKPNSKESLLYMNQLASNRDKAFEKWGFDLSAALLNWRQPITISLCMIVKNEEQVLERCLSSVKGIVDEIILVDTGSNDRTKEIAKQFTDRIFDFEWINDFAEARNFAFQQATQEYILWLDADDILLEEDANKLLKLKNSLPSDTDAVSMIYNLAFDEHGNVTSSLRRNRLVKRANNFKWIGAVHEYLEVYGNTHYAEICITHDRKHTQSSRNLHIYENKEAEGLSFSSRDFYYYANELLDHGLWERALNQYERFLERGDGWIEDVISSYGKAGDCLHNLGRTFEAKVKVLQAFAHTLPRAESCCRLGYYHMEESNYEAAVYWYKTAAALEKPQHTQALLNHACWSWLPHLQLCVCYNKLGLNELANEHNELAAAYIPDDKRILSNRSYFQSQNRTPINS